MLADFGLTPAAVRRDVETWRFYNSIVRMGHERLTKMVFKHDLESGGPWTQNLRNLLSSIVLETNLIRLTPVSLKTAEKLLMDCYTSIWEEEIGKKPKLTVLAETQSGWKVNHHMSANLSKMERSLISQLRCGVLPLMVETGLFKNLPRGQRVCATCPDEIEDSYHFLFRGVFHKGRE